MEEEISKETLDKIIRILKIYHSIDILRDMRGEAPTTETIDSFLKGKGIIRGLRDIIEDRRWSIMIHMLEIIILIEEKYNIVISDDEIESSMTLEELCDLIQEKRRSFKS